MAYDLGDPIPLAFIAKDSTGQPADATTVVLTITKPDATTATPALTHSTPGRYEPTAPYVANLAGIHRVSWVATGTNAQSQADVFNVLAADPRFLISLAEARTGLGTVASNTIKDEDLRGYIAAATPIMEDICGPILAQTRTETYDGGRPLIALRWAPVISVTSVKENLGANYSVTLNAEDLYGSTGSADAYGYTIDLDSGILTRRAAGASIPFMPGRSNVQVVYVSGRAIVRPNVLLATRRLIRHLWQSEQQGFRPAMSGPDQMATTPSGFAVPRAVIELAADDARLPGLA